MAAAGQETLPPASNPRGMRRLIVAVLALGVVLAGAGARGHDGCEISAGAGSHHLPAQPCLHVPFADPACRVGPDRIACLSQIDGTHTQACLYTDAARLAAPWYRGAAAGCAWTAQGGMFFFDPGEDIGAAPPGACVEILREDRQDPLVCLHTEGSRESCLVWTSFFRVCWVPDEE